ncbi:MAG TPA: L,D-transpeptidase family protein [Chloroflexota bacterium]|nr:L,D-transpeptidase family protein [Chloroflexota bacterium]
MVGYLAIRRSMFSVARYGTLSGVLLAVAFWLLVHPQTAEAGRFGPPWQAQVSVNQTVVYSQPDAGSQPVGPLGRGAIVVVTDQVKGTDGGDWTKIPDGYVHSGDLSEMYTPWTAEVTAPSVSVYAYPFGTSAIRRTARQGALLRVTGVSAGLEGDTNLWWATTEGYVPLGTLKWATNDWAGWWQLPDPSEATNGWWGIVASQANVRAASSSEAPVVGTFAGGEHVKVLAEEEGSAVGGNSVWYRIDGGRFAGGRVHSSLIRRLPDPQPNVAPLPAKYQSNSWIVVDRTHSTLTFVQDGQPKFVTYVSLGLAGVATPTGTYSTFGKFIGDRMSSRSVKDPTHPYDLPNVPFTQYYLDGGYGIHGTYWHDGFGSAESQGCINLTWADSAYLFKLTSPKVSDGYIYAWAGADGATPVVILD